MALAHIIVHGKVQGVGFRFSAQQIAAENDIKGWVKNNTDGTVEIEAEGDQNKIDDFIEEIQDGPNPYAKVDHVSVTMEDNEKGHKKFKVKY